MLVLKSEFTGERAAKGEHNKPLRGGGGGEVAWWLRAKAALTHDWGLIPARKWWFITVYNSSYRGCLFRPLWVPHICGTHTPMQVKHHTPKIESVFFWFLFLRVTLSLCVPITVPSLS